jgi:glutamine synthetase
MRKIERIIKKYNIKNVEVKFVDFLNVDRSVVIPTKRLNDAFAYGLKCDGSSVNCAKDISSSDIRLLLDQNSFYVLPNGNLLVMCCTDTQFDARAKLKEIETTICADGKKINFGAELEFFLFRTKNGNVEFNEVDNLQYFSELDSEFSTCLNEIVSFCEKSRVVVEAVHHECGLNQFELDFKYDSPLATADNIVFLKQIIRFFAQKHGLFACFMPKPLNGTSGSGMHINMSVFDDDTNLFFDETDKNHISKFAYKYINGIFKHIGAITALTNPNVNSYKRLNSGFETPTSVEYSAKNRSVLMRIPLGTQKTTRLELRSPDVSCNPYLAFASVLMAGFEDLFIKETAETEIPTKLPKSLKQSALCLEADLLISTLVPQTYIDKKILEQHEFEIFVNNLDIEKYLNI